MNKGEYIIDEDGFCCMVTNITSSSIEVFHLRKTEKGINCKQWYGIKDFQKRFRYGLYGYLDFINKSSTSQIETYFKTKSIIHDHVW